ncbi:hypothetical protein [Nostoc sp. FACHB-133]|uniref:hypothetical protein n=1 Tax=Nostoc sp. FACHB-133 TaxID=2692835 RepID=UPI001684B33E|nr:hypothetical protein [Nostoc sp. FACHB-133]MBD2524325.1 hypothetical protein [Nostoc sp. FACHB-133]
MINEIILIGKTVEEATEYVKINGYELFIVQDNWMVQNPLTRGVYVVVVDNKIAKLKDVRH